jgi:hypothetical protein
MSQKLTKEYIIQKDTELMEAGVALHARAFLVNFHWMRDNEINGDIFADGRMQFIQEIYDELYPKGTTTMPPIFTGGAAIRDNIYLVEVPLIFGSVPIDPIKLIRIAPPEIESAYRNFPDEFWNAMYQSADAFDFGYSVDDLCKHEENELLRNAASNLTSAVRTLNGKLDTEAAIQSACLTIELAGKGVLKAHKSEESHLKQLGHKLLEIVQAVITLKPSSEDANVLEIVSKLPNYVQSRYAMSNLNKHQLVSMTVNVQFAAASLLRRFTDRDLASQIAVANEIPPRKFKIV